MVPVFIQDQSSVIYLTVFNCIIKFVGLVCRIYQNQLFSYCHIKENLTIIYQLTRVIQIIIISLVKMYESKYALFVDRSEKVEGNKNYWYIVQKILKDYANQIDRYFYWDSYVRPTQLYAVQLIAQRRRHSSKEANPSVIAEQITKLKLDKIIIVTAAEVCDKTVKETDTILRKHNLKLEECICYVVSQRSYENMNLSVICPFISRCSSKVYYKCRNDVMRLAVDFRLDDYEMIHTFQTMRLDDFEVKYEKLQQMLILMNMGRDGGMPQMKNRLNNLKKNLLIRLSEKGKYKDYSKVIRLHLEENDVKSSLNIAQQMTYQYLSTDLGMIVDRKVNYLISLCGNLEECFNIQEIKSSKLKFAVEAQKGKLDHKIAHQELTQYVIECPIIMDEDVPQILVDQCQPVLLDVDKCIVDDVTTCPLRILAYPKLKAKLKSRLSTFTGVKLTQKIVKNPFTQNQLLGTIPLGRHYSHVKVGNYTIAKLMTGGKILGNLNLYYAVIWYLINENQIEYLKPIKENASEHLIYRLKNSQTTASMSGLPQFVATRVTTDVALWYIVNSGFFNLPTDRDIFRLHIFNMQPMIKILRVLKYPIHEGVKAHFFRTRAFLKMLYKMKKYNPNYRKAFKTIFEGFYQNGFFVDYTKVPYDFWEKQVCPLFIPVDGAATNEQIQHIRDIIPKCCKYLSNEEIYYLSKMLDQSKSASDVFLDYNVKINPLPKFKISWCYGLKQIENTHVPICCKTMRPYYKIDGTTWKKKAAMLYNIQDIDLLFKGNKYTQKFMRKYKKLPEFEQLAIFFYNRFIIAGKEDTLPFLCQRFVEQLVREYSIAGENVKYNSIKSRLHCSTKYVTRQEMEFGQIYL